MRNDERSGGQSPGAREGASIPLVLLPASAEHNLQDRSIEELIDRYWRPIREIRLGEEPPEPNNDFVLSISDLSDLPPCDREEVAGVFRNIYTEIRQRAGQIRMRITPDAGDGATDDR